MTRRWMTIVAVLGLAVGCGGKSGGGTTPQPDPDLENTETPPDETEVAAAAENGPEVCASRPDDFGPIELDAAAAGRRYGTTASTFADAPSTQEHAIEVCGAAGEVDYLTRVRCADGSAPFPDGMTAYQSRSGSVGAGGKCGTIIDLYVVPCPEATYEVYMDMYMCGPGEEQR